MLALGPRTSIASPRKGITEWADPMDHMRPWREYARLSTQTCSRWINAHCRGHKARCCKPLGGGASSSSGMEAAMRHSDQMTGKDGTHSSNVTPAGRLPANSIS